MLQRARALMRHVEAIHCNSSTWEIGIGKCQPRNRMTYGRKLYLSASLNSHPVHHVRNIDAFTTLPSLEFVFSIL